MEPRIPPQAPGVAPDSAGPRGPAALDRDLHFELELTHEALVRVRRRNLLLAAAIFGAFAWVDLLEPGAGLPALLVRGALVLAVLAGAAILPRVDDGGARAISYATGASVVLGMTLLAHLSGAADTHVHRILAAPLFLALVAPEDWDAVGVSGILAMLGGAAIASEARLPQWLGTACAATVLSTVLAHRAARQRRGAQELLREREEAQAELAESEARRLRAERLAVVGTLAAGVAHEINNPLSFVGANLGLLHRAAHGREVLDVAETREALGESLVGVERIRRIVTDLQTFARGEDGAARTCDLRAVVSEAVRLSALRTHGIARVETAVADDLPAAAASHARMVQVLTNLIINAADAIREGPVAEDLIRVEATFGGSTVRILVEDGGPGLPTRVREHLFEPFVTTKPPGQGTGLGMALAREYVVQAAGSIAAGDRPGGGTRIAIELPAAAAPRRSVA